MIYSRGNMKKIDNLLDKNTKSEEKIKAFSDLLDELSATKDKKKALWKEIYDSSI